MNRQTKLRMIRQLYAELPTIACKGYCANSCGPIDMSNVERDRLTQLGVDIPVYTAEDHQAWVHGERLDCPALVDKKSHPFSSRMRMGTCSVYEDRPLICRLWGVAESMPCESNCKVEPRMLTDAEAFDFLFRALAIGGEPHGIDVLEVRAKSEELAKDPEAGPLLAAMIRGDETARVRLLAYMTSGK